MKYIIWKSCIIILVLYSINLLAGCGSYSEIQNMQNDLRYKNSQYNKEDKPNSTKTMTRRLKPPSKRVKKRVAALELVNQTNLSQHETEYLTNLIRQALGRLPNSKFSIITSENIRTLLPPDKTLEDCSGSCAVETARLLGAHWLVTGKVVKIGKGLRVSLNLHNAESGELRGSDTIKGNQVEDLENSMQSSVLGMFVTLEPSLKRVVSRLKKGFIFKKFQLKEIPQIPKIKALKNKKEFKEEEEEKLDKLKPISMPKRQNIVKEGLGFSKINIDVLEQYEKVTNIDHNSKVSPEEKLAEWKKLQAISSGIKDIHETSIQRVKEWKSYIQKKKEYEAEVLRRHKEKLRIKKDKLNESLRQLQAHRKALVNVQVQLENTMIEDMNLENQRQEQIQKDWKKLKRLLPLNIVSREDKLNWLEAFVESYGAIKKLNPYIDKPIVKKYLRQLPRKYELKIQSRKEYNQKKARTSILKNKINTIDQEISLIDKKINTKIIKLSALFDKKHNTPKKSSLTSLTTKIIRKNTSKKMYQTLKKCDSSHIGCRDITWVTIPKGEFLMGSDQGDPDEKPVHLVRLPSFKISKSEVTVHQYELCVIDGICQLPKDGNQCNFGKKDFANHPVNCITWEQAKIFAKWAGGDLPTEAQWEYAARASHQNHQYPWGNKKATCRYAIMDDQDTGCNKNRTWPVCSKNIGNNKWGLCDVAGNLWEWTLDEYEPSYTYASPKGKVYCNTSNCQDWILGDSKRSIRGGSWKNYGEQLRISNRNRNRQHISSSTIGFRIVKSDVTNIKSRRASKSSKLKKRFIGTWAFDLKQYEKVLKRKYRLKTLVGHVKKHWTRSKYVISFTDDHVSITLGNSNSVNIYIYEVTKEKHNHYSILLLNVQTLKPVYRLYVKQIYRYLYVRNKKATIADEDSYTKLKKVKQRLQK